MKNKTSLHRLLYIDSKALYMPLSIASSITHDTSWRWDSDPTEKLKKTLTAVTNLCNQHQLSCIAITRCELILLTLPFTVTLTYVG